MGFGKMISGLFKKDAEEGVRANKSDPDMVSSGGLLEENNDSTKIPAGAGDSGAGGGGKDNLIPEAARESASDTTGHEDSGIDSSGGPAPGGVTEEKILQVLSNVYDPEIPIDIVNLGLIYGIDIEGGNVRITMTMTAPGCPASTQIAGESKILVEELPGVDNVEIELVWDPPWDPSKMSDDAQQSMGIF